MAAWICVHVGPADSANAADGAAVATRTRAAAAGRLKNLKTLTFGSPPTTNPAKGADRTVVEPAQSHLQGYRVVAMPQPGPGAALESQRVMPFARDGSIGAKKGMGVVPGPTGIG